MSKIIVLANKYPNRLEPNVCVFIQQLVWSFADEGYDCEVICPLPINLNYKYIFFPGCRTEISESEKVIKIYHPKYLSLGQQGALFQKSRVYFTTKAYELAVEKIFVKMNHKPDVLYGHFICPSGVVSARLGRKYAIPSFMAHGEATYSGHERYGNERLRKELENITGIIAVSSQNRDYLVDAGVAEPKKIQIFPNGYRPNRFYKIEKTVARKKWGFPEDLFIVGFCGSFDARKGVLRLQEAVDQLPNVYFACAGKGKQVPTSSKCIWKQPINNNELAFFYSAIDVFVLPTRHEGCCNAIVEAIACGCPIISANRSFNYDICDNSNSILIDPDNIDEIMSAIWLLKTNDNLRKQLSMGSLKKAEELTLAQRAKNILHFINI